MVQYLGQGSHFSEPQLIKFLLVQWYGHDMNHVRGWRSKCLHQIGFVDGDDPFAFSFLDPAEVICGVHLIPAFAYGQTSELLPSSQIACTKAEQNKDWQFYHVSM